MNAAELLPHLRELFSRDAEFTNREAWELAWLLVSLNYTTTISRTKPR